VETGPNLETDRSQQIAKGSRGENRPGRPIQRGEEPIAGDRLTIAGGPRILRATRN
jgi:hypothetical protein